MKDLFYEEDVATQQMGLKAVCVHFYEDSVGYEDLVTGAMVRMRFIGSEGVSRTKSSRGEVLYSSLWRGVDLWYYRTAIGWKSDWVIQADSEGLGAIQFSFESEEAPYLDEEGRLCIATNTGVFIEEIPVAMQFDHSLSKQIVAVQYNVRSDGSIGFEPNGEYDQKRPLLIDPVVRYSSYLGGTEFDSGKSIAVDLEGNAYVTGRTFSNDFPVTSGSFQTRLRGGSDAFITKVNPGGSSLLYSTYLGGIGVDFGCGIEVDEEQRAYVTGTTQSPNFPITSGAFQSKLAGSDAFVTKLNASGSSLLYSTFLGGANGVTQGADIKVDAEGNAYVAGASSSKEFPVTSGVIQTSFTGQSPNFAGTISKFNARGSSLLYSTYLGGSDETQLISALALDDSGNVYVTGGTLASNFPVTAGAFQTQLGGISSAFISKINATATTLLYSTFLGGNNFIDITEGHGISIDSDGNAYVTGCTSSTAFPTERAFQPNFGGNVDGFVSKFNRTGSALLYSSYLGGGGIDDGLSIALDSFQNAWISGLTQSENFPVTPDAFQSRRRGSQNAFIAQVSSIGSGLTYSSYLGGIASEAGEDIVVDEFRNVYMTGFTSSANFPVSLDAVQQQFGGNADAFLFSLVFPGQAVRGATGPTGATGERGPRGARGARGISGSNER
ncbi:SBBP repeat-containing protein [Mechercharimyces sp. CAU 1602]|uniref:SBBP repeat-containing protein n=1 Tax=Mechercharimyces sp. CAU 1602 TaxID=2973933 RepID=UPI0021625800|nr:SBBP repeat-containing protein [Mechercharimyces sp. CAU 1602]MCS1351234.1 SBBP repeat-containing protein [Mechercharimyces sp. CAU 1602]